MSFFGTEWVQNWVGQKPLSAGEECGMWSVDPWEFMARATQWIPWQPELHSEILFQKNQKKKNHKEIIIYFCWRREMGTFL